MDWFTYLANEVFNMSVGGFICFLIIAIPAELVGLLQFYAGIKLGEWPREPFAWIYMLMCVAIVILFVLCMIGKFG